MNESYCIIKQTTGVNFSDELDRFLDYLEGYGRDCRYKDTRQNFVAKSRKGGFFYKLIISPASSEGVDLGRLAYITVRIICRLKGIDDLDYMYAIHTDTEHEHVHVVIIDNENRTKLNPVFTIMQVRPLVSDCVRVMQRRENEEQTERERYAKGVNYYGTCVIDFEIQRLSILLLDGFYIAQARLKLLPEWKRDAIQQRVEFLKKIKLANEYGRVCNNFIWRLVSIGKAYKYRQVLASCGVDFLQVNCVLEKPQNIKTIILQQADDAKKHIVTFYNTEAGVVYFEDKIRPKTIDKN